MAKVKTGLPLELEILELFGRERLVVLGPTDVERATGTSKGSASPKLRSLAAAGYLKGVGGGKYQPGPKMMQLAFGYLGLVLAHIDDVRRLLDVDLVELRGALAPIAAILEEGGNRGS